MTIVSSHLSSFSAWQSMIKTYTHFLFLVIYLINADFLHTCNGTAIALREKLKHSENLYEVIMRMLALKRLCHRH